MYENELRWQSKDGVSRNQDALERFVEVSSCGGDCREGARMAHFSPTYSGRSFAQKRALDDSFF